MKLYKLPNGAWIDLRLVTALVPQSECVVVYHGANGVVAIPAKDGAHAQHMADALALDVNIAHQGGEA